LVLGLLASTWMFAMERQARQRALAAEEEARKKQAETETARQKLQNIERQNRNNLYVAEIRLAYAAWQEGRLKVALELLKNHLPEPGREDPRGFEWRYLWQLCQGDSLATLAGHKSQVQCIALSPDGRLLATGDGDREIKLWDAITHRALVTLSANASVRSLVFSPDGKTFAVADYSSALTLWDVAGLRKIGVVGNVPGFEKVLRFFPDGQRLACAASDGAVTIWDVAGKTRVCTLQGDEKFRPAIAISPDGAMLAAASGHREILLWDVVARRRLATLQGHASDVVALQFSPDGSTLASSSADTTIRLWDVGSRREVALLSGHRVQVSSITFSPDGGKLASTSVDGLIRIWDVASRAEVGILRGHDAWVNGVVFFPDGQRLVSVSDDMTVKFWSLSSLADGSVLKGQQGPAKDFHFLPDGKSLAILAEDKSLASWEVASGKQAARLAGRFVGFSNDGRIILGETASGELELWDSIARQPISTVIGGARMTNSITFSPDDRMLACADETGTTRVWEVATGRLQHTLPGTQDSIRDLWLPRAEKGFVLGIHRHSEPFRFWESEGTAAHDELPKGVQRTHRTLENGTRVSLLHDQLGDVRLESWDATGTQGFSLHSLLLVPGGQRIITGGDADIIVWDMATGRRLATLTGHGGWIEQLALSPDGRTLASTANDGTLRLWNLAIQKEVLTFAGRISAFSRRLAFAPDGNSIATLSVTEDHLVRLFHAPSFEEIDEAEAVQRNKGKQR
jgi:WD40 repeat protein